MNRRRFFILIIAVIMPVLVIGAAMVATGFIDLTPPREPAAHPTPAATRDARWLQDIDYLATQLPYLHVNAFHTVSESDFTMAVDDLRAQVTSLTDTEIIIALARVTALIGDGHTYADIHTPDFVRRYPLMLTRVDDAVLVVGSRESERHIIGGELLRIGEMSIAEAVEAVTPLIARDNNQQLVQEQGLFLTIPEVLAALDILADPESGIYTIRTIEGDTVTITLAPETLDEPTPLLSLYDTLDIELPISLTNRQANYWYTFLEDSGTLYFQYNRANEDPEQPFVDFNAGMFTFIDANPVERIVIDLRYNGGGNSAIIHPFVRELAARPALNAEGRVYVLIGPGTFSSALMNAVELSQETSAILAGEPTGGRPNHFGEVRRFTLPNSGLSIHYSTRFWNLLPDLDTPALEPDLLVPRTRDSLLSGRDVLLETVVNR